MSRPVIGGSKLNKPERIIEFGDSIKNRLSKTEFSSLKKHVETIINRSDDFIDSTIYREIYHHIHINIEDSKSIEKTVEVNLSEVKRELERVEKLLTEKEDDWQLKQRKAYLKGLLDENNPEKTVTIPLLGEYVNLHRLGFFPTVYLYINNMKDSNEKLDEDLFFQVFFHELTHAYFDTKNFIEEIEEPIVECQALHIVKAYKENYFPTAYKEVQDKQFDLGIVHYGFGTYLYDHVENWEDFMKAYQARKETITEAECIAYKKYFLGSYPFQYEKECLDLLNGILHIFNNL